MTKMQLIRAIIRLLDTEKGLDFLLKLDEKDLMILTACIRERVDSLRAA